MNKFWCIVCAVVLIILGVLTQGDDGKGIPRARAQMGLAPFACNQTFQVSQAATALTKIVTSTNRVITICGWAFNAGAAAATAQLEYGTGTNCGTGTTVITPAFSLGINGVLVDHPGLPNIFLPNNNDLCLVTTGTGPMQVLIHYTVQ
jgi:hypothetical protein